MSKLDRPLGDTQVKTSVEFCRQVGVATSLMLQTKKYPHFAVGCIKVWLYPPILMRQIRFFYDYRGQPVGYVTWAFLAEDVVERLTSDPGFMLHDSEWNEGNNVWIMDFVAVSGYARTVVAELGRTQFSGYRVVRSARRADNGRVLRVSTWRNNSAGEP